MSRFWDLETIGISTSKESKEDIRDKVVQEFRDKINFVNGRYAIQLPWKDDMKNTLMSNESHVMKRLNKLLVKLDKDEDLKVEYMKVLMSMSLWE